MNKANFVFIGAGLFVYLLASQTQIGWLYLFDAIIWSLLLLSAIIPWWSLRALRLERQVLLPDSSFRHWQLAGPREDETVEIKLKVTNRGRLTRHLIKVIEECPFAEAEKQPRVFFLTTIKSNSTITFSYTATGYHRGHYPESRVTVQSSGPLGLLTRRRSFNLPLKLTVYPLFYQMKGLTAAEASWADWGQVTRSTTAAEFYGSREYRQGDPLKNIHWRNTARLGRFMLKEFEQSSQGSLAVAFPTDRNYGNGRETTLEYSIRIAASLTRFSTDSGNNIDIVAGANRLSNAGWPAALNFLARVAVDSNTKSELSVTASPGQVTVAVLSAAETALIPSLAQLAERTTRLVLVLLEGFTADEAPDKFLSGINKANLEIIRCSRGNLAATIEKLGASLLAGSKLATVG